MKFFVLLFFSSLTIFSYAQDYGYGFDYQSTGSPLLSNGSNASINFASNLPDTSRTISMSFSNKYLINSWNQLQGSYAYHNRYFRYGIGVTTDGFEGFRFSKINFSLAKKINQFDLGASIQTWQWYVEDANYQILPVISWGGKVDVLKHKLWANLNSTFLLGAGKFKNPISQNYMNALLMYAPMSQFYTFIGINSSDFQEYNVLLGFRYIIHKTLLFQNAYNFRNKVWNGGFQIPVRNYQFGYSVQWNLILGVSQGVQIDYRF